MKIMEIRGPLENNRNRKNLEKRETTGIRSAWKSRKPGEPEKIAEEWKVRENTKIIETRKNIEICNGKRESIEITRSRRT
jgi:hypothetical protein